MALKFFQIGKANEEISRLEGIVADRDAALAEAQTRIATLETAPKGDAQVVADLATARQTIGTLETQVKKLTTDVEAAKSEAVTAKAEAEKVASQKAAAITAAQGQPPIDNKPSGNPTATKPDVSELKGLDKAIAAHKASYSVK